MELEHCPNNNHRSAERGANRGKSSDERVRRPLPVSTKEEREQHDAFVERLVNAHTAVLASYTAKRHPHAADIASDAMRRVYQAACGGSSIYRGTADEVRQYTFRAAKTAEADIYRQAAPTGSEAPPGWYEDPSDATGAMSRYWNGFAWTDTARDWSGEEVKDPLKGRYRPQCTLPVSIEGFGWREGTSADITMAEPGDDSAEAFVDLQSTIADLLSKLPSAQRQAVRRELQGYTYQQTAEEMGINPNTASSHRVRGLAALRTALRAALKDDG